MDYKMDKKSIINDLYQTAVVSTFIIGYSMLGKKILKMTPPSIQKFDLENTEKLVAIVATSEMTRERAPHQTENSTGTHQHLKWLALRC